MAESMLYGYSLTVEPWCEECQDFEPHHEIQTFDLGRHETATYHYISCKNLTNCRRMYDHIRKAEGYLTSDEWEAR